MSVEIVREYLKPFGKDTAIREFAVSSATVALAAEALGVIPARIAKTLSFKSGDSCVLVVAAGDARVAGSKYKAFFGKKAVMLSPEEALEQTGHAVGGVCPFALPADVAAYLDVSLRRFETVFPACGSASSAVELSPDELFACSRALPGLMSAPAGTGNDRHTPREGLTGFRPPGPEVPWEDKFHTMVIVNA